MYHRKLEKPDGRALHLYSREPMEGSFEAPVPFRLSSAPNPHLRWHPFRGEWVAYASHRQDRTFLPPAEYSPLAVTTSPQFPTELPPGKYDVAVFENLFPSLSRHSHSPPQTIVPTRSARGACEVVVFSQDPSTSLARLPLSHIELILEVWGERYQELGAREEIQYVMPFENRGVEMGVTIHHPHGQIYAYPFVPPIPAKELEEQAKHLAQHGRGLLESIITDEKREGTRIVHETAHAIAFVPAFARYPYEVWIAPFRSAASIAELSREERADLAATMKTVLMKYDGLWNRPFPYLMAAHQAPTDGNTHPEAHLHWECYPPYRTRERVKFLAGTELAAGMFASDALPEEKARELQQVEVDIR